MDTEGKVTWSVGSIIFLVLYCLVTLTVIMNIFEYRHVPSVYKEFNVETPFITNFFAQYGYIMSSGVVLLTLFILIREFRTQKVINFKNSLLVFIIILIWGTFFRWAYLLPAFQIANIGR